MSKESAEQLEITGTGTTKKIEITTKTSGATQGMEILGSSINRDGVGLGIGMVAIALLVLITWSVTHLTKNINLSEVAFKINRYIEDTKYKLEKIDHGIDTNQHKIDTLLRISERSEDMIREARNAGLDMSGELRDLRNKVDHAIQEIKSSKWNLSLYSQPKLCKARSWWCSGYLLPQPQS